MRDLQGLEKVRLNLMPFLGTAELRPPLPEHLLLLLCSSPITELSSSHVQAISSTENAITIHQAHFSPRVKPSVLPEVARDL